MKQALRDLIRLPRCIGLVTHGNNARRHLGLGIWRTRSLVDQQAAGCSYRQSAISRLPGSFSTHMGSKPPVCRGIYENDSRTRTEGSIDGAGASPGPWPGVTNPRETRLAGGWKGL